MNNKLRKKKLKCIIYFLQFENAKVYLLSRSASQSWVNNNLIFFFIFDSIMNQRFIRISKVFQIFIKTGFDVFSFWISHRNSSNNACRQKKQNIYLFYTQKKIINRQIHFILWDLKKDNKKSVVLCYFRLLSSKNHTSRQ